ncbi:TnsA endonuclease N-terminal domain-containing protein [Pandoraea captiosa]|uniref:TnsA endonuclease N-terminal domain-containing protein n=1 Tax=Pandoraea captiosa TaxID=2508302 RepID=UPI001FE27ED1|nr:TnsA endonuclease N-terminal domain-containing protein [Pandoraea captiosa]
MSGVYMFRGLSAIQYESTLERDFLIRMAHLRDVLDVVPQPVEVPFLEPLGRPNIYTPDFLVYYRAGFPNLDNYRKPLLVEVKPGEAWRAHWRSWSGKWKAARRYAHEHGWRFQIFDESRIRDQTLLNIRFLERFERLMFDETESAWIVSNLAAVGAAPFHYLVARHFMGDDRAIGIAHIWHLLWAGRIECDMSMPLSEHTELWVPEHE